MRNPNARVCPQAGITAMLVIAVKTEPSATLHDAGTLDGYLQARVAFALNDAELGAVPRQQFGGALS